MLSFDGATDSPDNRKRAQSMSEMTSLDTKAAKLMPEHEYEEVRKERNRMHARMTRNRKRIFTERMREMIDSLEKRNGEMKSRLLAISNANNRMAPSPTQNHYSRHWATERGLVIDLDAPSSSSVQQQPLSERMVSEVLRRVASDAKPSVVHSQDGGTSVSVVTASSGDTRDTNHQDSDNSISTHSPHSSPPQSVTDASNAYGSNVIDTSWGE